MENKMNKPVDVICYGQREHFETRQDAINKYAEGMVACEGSEQERYAKIHFALVHGSADIVTDGSSERVEAKPSVKFTADDKDKIINFIIADVLSINSPEIYDRGKCKLVVEDRDIIKALLKKEGWYAAQFLTRYIENDKELLVEAARGGEGERGALAYASDELCDDKEFVFEMLNLDASDFRYVSDRLANDIEVIVKAFQCAKTEYDFDCIKEGLGKELLTEMVQEMARARFDKQHTAKETISDERKKSLDEQISVASASKEYELTLFQGKENEEMIRAFLTDEQVAMICKKISGVSTTEHKITFMDGSVLDVGCIDAIEILDGDSLMSARQSTLDNKER